MDLGIDGKWLKIFELKTPAAVTCLAFGLLSLLELQAGWVSFRDADSWAGSIFLLFVNAGAALLCGRALVAVPEWFARRQRRIDKLQALNALTDEARQVLCYLTTKKTRAFLAPGDCRIVRQLVEAFLVDRLSGGTLDKSPYAVRNDVWKELQRRRRDFRTDNVNGLPPWSTEHRGRGF